jgi:hypothetical protein
LLTSTPSRSHRSTARTAVVFFVVLIVVGVLLAGYGLTHSGGSHPHAASTTAATTAAAVTTAARSLTPSPQALPAGVVAFVALPVGTPPSPGGSELVYPWHRLIATITGPAQVRAGETADYRVRLTNGTAQPIPLDPCPAFDLSVGLHTSSYGLNCAGASVAVIAAGASLSLDLPVYIPRSLSSGTKTDVAWSLGWQPDRTSPQARLTVTVS